MNLKQLQEKLSSSLEDSVVESAEAVEANSRPSKSLTIEKPLPKERRGDSRHCRLCKHLKVSVMPTVPSAGEKFLTVQAISASGKVHIVPIEKVSGRKFVVCELENWECGPGLANPNDLKGPHGYFKEQAELCSDYET